MSRVLVLDNDECTGSYGVLSIFFKVLLFNISAVQVTNPITNDQKKGVLCQIAYFLGKTIFKQRFARPNIGIFLKVVSELKKATTISDVVMYTFASDESGLYTSWVQYLLAGCADNTDPQTLFTVLISRTIQEQNGYPYKADDSIRKQIDLVRKLTKKQDASVLMFDDVPYTIVEKYVVDGAANETITPLQKSSVVIGVPPFDVILGTDPIYDDSQFAKFVWTEIRNFLVSVQSEIFAALVMDRMYSRPTDPVPLPCEVVIQQVLEADSRASYYYGKRSTINDNAVATIMLPNLKAWTESKTDFELGGGGFKRNSFHKKRTNFVSNHFLPQYGGDSI